MEYFSAGRFQENADTFRFLVPVKAPAFALPRRDPVTPERRYVLPLLLPCLFNAVLILAEALFFLTT